MCKTKCAPLIKSSLNESNFAFVSNKIASSGLPSSLGSVNVNSTAAKISAVGIV